MILRFTVNGNRIRANFEMSRSVKPNGIRDRLERRVGELNRLDHTLMNLGAELQLSLGDKHWQSGVQVQCQ